MKLRREAFELAHPEPQVARRAFDAFLFSIWEDCSPLVDCSQAAMTPSFGSFEADLKLLFDTLGPIALRFVLVIDSFICSFLAVGRSCSAIIPPLEDRQGRVRAGLTQKVAST